MLHTIPEEVAPVEFKKEIFLVTKETNAGAPYLTGVMWIGEETVLSMGLFLPKPKEGKAPNPNLVMKGKASVGDYELGTEIVVFWVSLYQNDNGDLYAYLNPNKEIDPEGELETLTCTFEADDEGRYRGNWEVKADKPRVSAKEMTLDDVKAAFRQAKGVA